MATKTKSKPTGKKTAAHKPAKSAAAHKPSAKAKIEKKTHAAAAKTHAPAKAHPAAKPHHREETHAKPAAKIDKSTSASLSLIDEKAPRPKRAEGEAKITKTVLPPISRLREANR